MIINIKWNKENQNQKIFFAMKEKITWNYYIKLKFFRKNYRFAKIHQEIKIW